MSVKNVLIFGQSGTGKSSVVNLMAGEKKAKTSNETKRCTIHWEEHRIDFSEHTFKVFDTIGIEEPQLGIDEYLAVIENSYNLITRLQKQGGGIDLLLFCVRAGRYTSTIHNNYRLFYECLCEEKVPIVLIITGLERESNMESWWTRSKAEFDKYDVVVNDHACITAIHGTDWNQHYEDSRRLVRDLVLKHCYKSGPHELADEGWLSRFTIKLKEVFVRVLGSKKKKKIVDVLTNRCGMPREAALRLATRITTT